WLDALLREKCRIPYVYQHQLVHGKDLVDGHDLFLVIATGKGKTIILHAPLIAAQARKERGIAFLIVPTKVLAEQQAEVAQRNGLRALAINEDSVREAGLQKRDLFAEFAGGDGISVGVMSPQMLRSSRVNKLLSNQTFKSAVRWMLIDEAHVIDEASGTFKEPYKAILHLRPRLPSHTVWAAVTATATPVRAFAIAAALGFRSSQYVNVRYSTDRPNIKYIPRFFAHAISGFQFFDFSFVVPFDMLSAQEILLTLIFVKTIQAGYRLMQFLDTLISHKIPNRLGIIKLYNSLMPLDYRREFIADITEGQTLRIGIVTGTCTYGTDIPTLQRVIIAHFTADSLADGPEIQKQQMGRPGRDGKSALAIVYAPAWVQEVPASEIVKKQALADLERRQKLPAVTREFFNPTPECCSRAADLKYNGEPFVLRPGCCSLHEPEPECRDLDMVATWIHHFKLVQEGKKTKTIRADGTYRPLDTRLKGSLKNILVQWRARKYVIIRGERRGTFAAMVLPQHLLDRILDRAHACSSLDRLWGVMHDWDFLERFGEDLFAILTQVMPEYSQIIDARKE
ncbi:P-loop containing nucleoside triphosphate hydrolase protein, partial [Mycena rebaudengoi]